VELGRILCQHAWRRGALQGGCNGPLNDISLTGRLCARRFCRKPTKSQKIIIIKKKNRKNYLFALAKRFATIIYFPKLFIIVNRLTNSNFYSNSYLNLQPRGQRVFVRVIIRPYVIKARIYTIVDHIE